MSDREDVFGPLHLFEGGPFHRLMRRLGLDGCAGARIRKRILFWACVAWVPPVALALLHGSPPDEVVPVLRDFPLHVRCLIAIPILLAAECHVSRHCDVAMQVVASRGMVAPEAIEGVARTRQRIASLRESRVVELVLLAASLAFVASQAYIDLPAEVATWRRAASGLGRLAHAWDQWVGLPLYYFLALRFASRFLLWSYFLFGLAASRPRLQSLHPDGNGGLSFLVHRHLRFGLVALALSSVISAKISQVVSFGGVPVDAFAFPVVFYLVTIEAIFLVPLLAFTPTLLVARRLGIDKYGSFANRYVRDFDGQWLGRQDVASPLGTSDIQSLNDLIGSYQTQARMRPLMMKRDHFIALAVLSVAPLLPLLLYKVPLRQILSLLARVVM